MGSKEPMQSDFLNSINKVFKHFKQDSSLFLSQQETFEFIILLGR